MNSVWLAAQVIFPLKRVWPSVEVKIKTTNVSSGLCDCPLLYLPNFEVQIILLPLLVVVVVVVVVIFQILCPM